MEARKAERKKILLIDDTHTFLLILNNILKEDYETIIATDGEEGLETARLTSPDLILLHVLMPGMSGYDVLRALKSDESTKSIPVILASGKDIDNHEAEAATLGAVGFLKKPFDKVEVQENVAKVFNS